MSVFDDVKDLSPLPIVNLEGIDVPSDGVLQETPACCSKFFERRDKCLKHYQRIADADGEIGFVQCPYGFATLPVIIGKLQVALTSFVPYPRLGEPRVDKERARGKEHPNTKCTREDVHRAADAIRTIYRRLRRIEQDTIVRQSMALHEIRKLNRTVKQTAERICRQESPEEPADADSRHVRIWKSAELMSKQFDIIEILANEDLTKLPLDTEISVYRAFDKCVRIFQPASDPGRIKIETGHHSRYDPIIRACDKTFTILATVLIENALKYALPNTPIVVRVEPDGKSCIVKVSNYANAKKELDESIFERGVRGTNDTDGSGNGLYVAQMVAEQHNSRIQLEVSDPVNGKVIHSFTMRFETIRHG